MGDFLKKVEEEIEKVADAVEPTAGDPQALDVARVAEAEREAGTGSAEEFHLGGN